MTGPAHVGDIARHRYVLRYLPFSGKPHLAAAPEHEVAWCSSGRGDADHLVLGHLHNDLALCGRRTDVIFGSSHVPRNPCRSCVSVLRRNYMTPDEVQP